jgi:glyoxylase-like metal-dependent hydrolase (beta-lactamase superfamily II)
LKLRYSMETHVHTDHVTGSGKLRQLLGCTVMLHENSNAKHADILLRDNDRIPLGEHKIRVIHTPGLTSADVCYLAGDMVFTGDTLLIDDCGQTDPASSDAGTLYDSITSRLFTLPDNTVVYPGHDYQDKTHSTVFAEKTGNAKIGGGRPRDDFIRLLSTREPGQPRCINEAITANLTLGLN